MKKLDNYDYTSEKSKKEFSQYLSFLLRHCPEDISLKLEEDGWLLVEDLLNNMKNHDKWDVNLDFLKRIVADDKKGRYSFKDEFKYIRANQGHSIKELKMNFKEYESKGPLYHGTAKRFFESIKRDGLLPMSRQYVHLSRDFETAVNVAKRHTKDDELIIFEIDVDRMKDDGYAFYESENNVILVKCIPFKYLKF